MSGPRASRVERVYDRTARIYDWMEAPMEWMGGRDRRSRVLGTATGRVLEVGVGTGRNLPLYPPAVDEVVGVDLAARMLEKARRRIPARRPRVELRRADVESLPFPDASFDTAVATCVFCSVEDPVRGLRELRRVVRPDGRILLLEHVRPRNPVLGRIFDWLSPLTRRLIGPEINRRTEHNVRRAGLEMVQVRRDGIWREIVARPARPGDPSQADGGGG